MPRKPLIRCGEFPYHITSRSNDQQWFALPMEQVWNLFCSSMRLAHQKHPVDIISFVLMSNHYHLMVKTPECNLDLFMYELNKNFSLKLRHQTDHINRMFGGRYKWCLIRSWSYFLNCYRYVYQNPLRAGLVQKCEDYPWSTIHYKSRGLLLGMPLADNTGLAHGYKLRWLNQPVQEREKAAIKNALYRSELVDLKL